MAKDYIRVKRGMVFSYNINPSVDKFNIPKLHVCNKEYEDHIQYGWRTYVVVSNNINNATSPTCNIVPMTAQQDKSNIPTHVEYTAAGQKLSILCEHVYTVNTVELLQYQYILSDEIMDKVDEALALQFTLKNKTTKGIELSLAKIESIINGIIQQRVEELTPKSDPKASTVDIEDAVLRIGAGLESIMKSSHVPEVVKEEKPTVLPTTDKKIISPKTNINISTEKPKIPAKPISQVDKFYKKYPEQKVSVVTTPNKKEVNVVTTPNKKNSSRRKWTEDSMREFLDDSTNYPVDKMIKKYSFSSANAYYQMKYYIQTKLSQKKG